MSCWCCVGVLSGVADHPEPPERIRCQNCSTPPRGACFCAFRLGGQCADSPAASARSSARSRRQGIAQCSVRGDDGDALAQAKRFNDPSPMRRSARSRTSSSIARWQDHRIPSLPSAASLEWARKTLRCLSMAVQFKTKDNNKFYPVMNTTRGRTEECPRPQI